METATQNLSEWYDTLNYKCFQAPAGRLSSFITLAPRVSHLSSHTDFIVFLEMEELRAETERQKLHIWTQGWFKAENTTVKEQALQNKTFVVTTVVSR